MRRRLTLAALVLSTVLVPAAATATISPDIPYGDGGTASVVTDCAPGTLQGATPKAGYGGRMFVLEQCGSGYHRIFAVGDDGEPVSGYGTGGRVTVKVPSVCLGEQAELVPAKDGSVYGLFWGLSAPAGSEVVTDLHVCAVRVGPTGKLATQYGGNGPVRRLDRPSDEFQRLDGGAVDSKGRLLVFTQRMTGIWQHSAAFINRFALNGRPDISFSQDGQRAYTYRYHETLQWGGVIGDKPVIAIRARSTSDDAAPLGIAFVRFGERGDLDGTFSGDGKVFYSRSAMGGAHTGGGRILVDEHQRIVFVVQQGSPDGTAMWLDLRRIGPSGVDDARFREATRRVDSPGVTRIPDPRLQLTAGRYAVSWEFEPAGDDRFRTTGYNGNGTRWTALGANGTTSTLVQQFAPDLAKFYEFAYFSGEGPDQVQITRRTVG